MGPCSQWELLESSCQCAILLNIVGQAHNTVFWNCGQAAYYCGGFNSVGLLILSILTILSIMTRSTILSILDSLDTLMGLTYKSRVVGTRVGKDLLELELTNLDTMSVGPF